MNSKNLIIISTKSRFCHETGIPNSVIFLEPLSILIYVFSDLYFHEHIRKSGFYHCCDYCSHNYNRHSNIPCKCPCTHNCRYHYNLNNRRGCILDLSANEKVHLGEDPIIQVTLVH